MVEVILKLFVFIIIMGCIFAIGYGGFYYLKTIFFRKNIKKGDTCKFYIGDEKCFGKIIDIDKELIEVEFLDAGGVYERCFFHRFNLYPAW